MQKWEYRIWHPPLAVNTRKTVSPAHATQESKAAYEDELAKWGNEGWELVAVRAEREEDDSFWAIHWFKRPVEDD